MYMWSGGQTRELCCYQVTAERKQIMSDEAYYGRIIDVGKARFASRSSVTVDAIAGESVVGKKILVRITRG
jgi:hypothetical protein